MVTSTALRISSLKYYHQIKKGYCDKENLYENAGVKEYFIINPADRKLFVTL